MASRAIASVEKVRTGPVLDVLLALGAAEEGLTQILRKADRPVTRLQEVFERNPDVDGDRAYDLSELTRQAFRGHDEAISSVVTALQEVGRHAQAAVEGVDGDDAVATLVVASPDGGTLTFDACLKRLAENASRRADEVTEAGGAIAAFMSSGGPSSWSALCEPLCAIERARNGIGADSRLVANMADALGSFRHDAQRISDALGSSVGG